MGISIIITLITSILIYFYINKVLIRVGDKVVYNKQIKSLESNSIGVVTNIGKDALGKKYYTITYNQNLGTNNVYAHASKRK